MSIPATIFGTQLLVRCSCIYFDSYVIAHINYNFCSKGVVLFYCPSFFSNTSNQWNCIHLNTSVQEMNFATATAYVYTSFLTVFLNPSMLFAISKITCTCHYKPNNPWSQKTNGHDLYL